MKRHLALLVCACLLLNSCGDTRIERTGSGAAIGAGAGIVSGFLCCKDPGDARPGMFIGAAVGALIGLLINEPLFFNSSR
jgi:hypothetical protein